MPPAPGTYTFGPHNAELLVHTRRSGTVAVAGHDLVIEVTSWSGTLQRDDDPDTITVALSADGGSLWVREGRGGIQPLGEEDKTSIKQSIDEDVLKRRTIAFRSRRVRGGSVMTVEGDLELLGVTRPIAFELEFAPDGRLTAHATVKQTDFGLKPYSVLFGALKVLDEVEVTLDAKL
jgi:polyisoprenoid-binding protein YceI